jgi:GWxTD domain-containing protein
MAEDARANFEMFLRGTPNATMDPSMYSKKAVAAFTQAKTAMEPPPDTGKTGGAPSIFNAYQEYKPPPNISEPPSPTWGDGPVVWLMTPDEKKTWSQLANDGERAEFVEKFWAVRNPNGEGGENTFRTGFERRVAFADAKFVQDERKRGSMTDRGMVFVLLGPPTYGGRKPIRTGDDSSEAAGMSQYSSAASAIAVGQAQAPKSMDSGPTKLTSGQTAAINDHYSGPGNTAPVAANNYQEVWHYRKELLPKGVSYQLVDVTFITKKGYGVNVLQRDPMTLTTLDAAKRKPD